MVTNFAEMLPQKRGALEAEAQASRYSAGSSELDELLKMKNAGMEVADMIAYALPSGELPRQGRLNSRGNNKVPPPQYADRIADQMLKAGKTPQEIGAVVAAILGFKK